MPKLDGNQEKVYYRVVEFEQEGGDHAVTSICEYGCDGSLASQQFIAEELLSCLGRMWRGDIVKVTIDAALPGETWDAG
jgi:hypothetical protein